MDAAYPAYAAALSAATAARMPPLDRSYGALIDLAGFQRCFSGSGPAKLARCCTVFASERDGDVDLTDFVAFRGAFSGP